MRIVIGAPSNGVALKDALKEALVADDRVTEVLDLSEANTQYPEVSFEAAHAILAGRADRGILICGTGLGTSIAANKVAGIRAATAHDLVSVRGSVENYDAQILRSEERRVGKECRSEWWGEDRKHNKRERGVEEELREYR